ncbi:hypothetical protein OPQ81_001959 [Rhizoctonia solani]|nr:hypothetical protein OPQ81_001959 [Rhizoctonia solani]
MDFPHHNNMRPPPGPPQSRAYNPSYNPSYAPPSGPPPGQPGFPQPGGPSNSPGYHPSYNPSYAPPSGPPPVPGNRPENMYSPPAGPPPAGPPPSGPPPIPHRTSSTGGGYPGQSYHQNQASNPNGQGWQQNNPSYPGGAPINWNTQGTQGAINSNANGGSPAPAPGPGAWYQGPPGGQTGYGTGGPGHPGGTPALGNAHMPPSGQQFYGPSQTNNGPQMSFQYSMCTGRKKALSIGINYFGQQGELRGCINDSNNMCEFLIRQFGYKNEDIVRLTDDAKNPNQMPTRENILRAMQWLVKDARPNDSLFFHYSGHGGQTKDLDGDEADGYDEVIYPMDFEHAGHIVDDDMHSIMVKPLPDGCRLTAIFDSCHSGSALDLPYIYSTEGKIKEPNLLADAGQGLLSAGMSYARGDMSGMMKGLGSLIKTATGGQKKADDYARQTRTSAADVISWSGCKDSQTSADTVEAGEATGAMSYAFIDVLRQKPQQTYQELLNNIRDVLKRKYSQKPQLSSSHPMDTTILFIA